MLNFDENAICAAASSTSTSFWLPFYSVLNMILILSVTDPLT